VILCVDGCGVDIEGCDFEYNVAYEFCGTILIANYASLDIRNTRIFNNMSLYAAGGIYAEANCDVTMEDCNVSNNISTDGAGVVVYDYCTLSAKNCLFALNNSVGGDGGALLVAAASQAQIKGCAVLNNVAGDGAGIFSDLFSDVTGINCTIAGNFANSFGGGFYGSTNSSSVFQNSIIWANSAGNSGHQVYLDDVGDDFDLDYSDYANNALDPENIAGNGNFNSVNCITADPMFKNLDEADVRLTALSPCIDAGLNMYAFVADLIKDLEGNMRVFDGDSDGTPDVDMGALEYQR
jgi:hypothetical protein